MRYKNDSEIDYYYMFGNCVYECKYKGDYFDLTNSEIERTKSEDELINLGAVKLYYATYSKDEIEMLIRDFYDTFCENTGLEEMREEWITKNL